MPKRSNDFQKLVSLVKRHSADGAQVEESAFLPDLVTGKPREVDVVLRTKVGGHDVTVSIECRAHARRTPVTWVEEMRAKHDRLPTHALVLVSRSGFSQQAIEVAASYGIELLDLRELSDDGAQQLFGQAESLVGKTFTLRPERVLITVPADEELPWEKVLAFSDTLLHSETGAILGTVRELVEALLQPGPVVERLGRDGTDEHLGFTIEWVAPADSAGNRLYLKKLAPERLRPIDSLQLTGRCEFAVSGFRLHRGALGNLEVAWATGRLLDRETLLVASREEGSDPKMSLHFSGSGKDAKLNSSM